MASLVATLVQAKQNDKAIAILQNALKSNPDNAEALVLLGSLRQQANAPDEAVKNFKTAIQKEPKSILGYRALASFYLQQKNYDEALGVVQSGLKELPENIDLHMIWAGILESKGDYEGAISQYEQVLNQQPGFVVAANNLASLLADHRTDAASLERARSLAASLRETQVPQFKDTLGWVNYRKGDVRSAIPLLEQAAESLPDVALVHYHLGVGYAASGQYARASDQFKLALNMAPSKDLAEMIETEMKKAMAQ
jgi:cellulose synthase operon protein C